MLSFDITDKIIRIVRGFESSGKIKIYDAFSIDIPEKSIENGNIVDVTGLASIIGDILKSKKIKEKSAIVSISSNLTIFKELDIPKAKGQQFLKMVKAEMQAQLGIDDTYSVSYLIVGEVEDKNEKGIRNRSLRFSLLFVFRKLFRLQFRRMPRQGMVRKQEMFSFQKYRALLRMRRGMQKRLVSQNQALWIHRICEKIW